MAESHDTPTVIGIALVAWAAAAVVHEGFGHGGACVLVGGAPRTLNACYFQCDASKLSAVANRWIAAGGTLSNLLFAAGAWGVLAGARDRVRPATRYFLWAFFAVNLLDAFGYFMFSGFMGIGDWVEVVRGWSPAWGWRAGLAVVGTGLYFGVAPRWIRRDLQAFLGTGPDRVHQSNVVALWPYLAGGIQSVVAGLLNPESPLLVLISAAAASFGGASLLAWYPRLVAREEAPPGVAPAWIERSPGWIVAGAVVSVAFVLVLGRGVAL